MSSRGLPSADRVACGAANAIADLAGAPTVLTAHVAEAVQYRRALKAAPLARAARRVL